MNKILFGIHICDIDNIPIYFKKYNIKFFQIYPNSLTLSKYKSNKSFIQKNNIQIVVHASYSINLASQWSSKSWMVQQLISQIKLAHSIKSKYIVVHVGKSKKLKLNIAINNMYSALLYIHSQTTKYKDVQILIETPAGQGTEILTNIHDLCYFMNKFYNHPKKDIQNRFKLCIDTCHIFAAGYDLNDKKIIDQYFNTIHKNIKTKNIGLFHLNNSKNKVKSNIDRHQNLSSGFIHIDNIKYIINKILKYKFNIILETPHQNIIDDYYLIHTL